MEHKRHIVDDPSTPANPKAVGQPPSQPVVNGDALALRHDSRPSTPQTTHKTVTFDTPERNSKVFALIAGHTGRKIKS